MQRKLDYVYFPGAVSAQMCDAIVAYGDKQNLLPGIIVNDQGLYVNHGERKDISQRLPRDDENGWLFDEVWRIFQTLNTQHWDFAIETPEALQYSLYEPGGHITWHRDTLRVRHRGSPKLTRKISLSVQLSDPKDYVGGYFEVAANQSTRFPEYRFEDMALDDPQRVTAEKMRARGTLIAFPSIMIHRVSPVLAGQRRALVAWALGSPEALDEAFENTNY